MRLGRALGRAAIAIAALALAASVHAQSLYPSKPIRMVVGFPPGGEMDLSARLYSTKLQEALNTPIVVENRPGGTGLLAGEHVAKAAPDGYTLFVGASGQMTINPVLMAKHPYERAAPLRAATRARGDIRAGAPHAGPRRRRSIGCWTSRRRPRGSRRCGHGPGRPAAIRSSGCPDRA